MFAKDEWTLMYEDQKAALENIHRGEACIDISDCPLYHFDVDYEIRENTIEIETRQAIMKKVSRKKSLGVWERDVK